MKETLLVTGAAGFIGAALSLRLIEEGFNVIGIDNLNNYYDINLKKSRLKNIYDQLNNSKGGWKFYQKDLKDFPEIKKIFSYHKPKIVFNMAAQAGVRYSLINPSAYINSNIVGFSNILELCKDFDVKNLVYASSSSVYGNNKQIPFKEDHPVDKPVSLYAATKKSNEVMAYTYSHLYNLPTIGLRFFTVYGPWGRPDMAPMIFAKAIIDKKPISIFNYGRMQRDFTYIDDVIEGVIKCGLKQSHTKNDPITLGSETKKLSVPHKIFNIGRGDPVKLLDFVEIIEDELEIKAIKKFQSIQPGDVEITFADTRELKKWINFTPKISIKEGIRRFIAWYSNFYPS